MRHRIDLEQGDFSRVDTRPLYNIGVAVTGSLDYSGAEPHLAFGVAGTRMPVAVMKRHVADLRRCPRARMGREPHVRRHRRAGGDRRQCAAAEFQGRRPADARRRPVGRSRDQRHDAAAAPTSAGNPRRRSHRPHHRPPSPPSASAAARSTWRRGASSMSPTAFSRCRTPIPKPAPAHVRFRIDGTVPAAAALLASEALRDNVGTRARSGLEPRHGRRPGHASICWSGATCRRIPPAYAITADLTNFAADKMLLGRQGRSPVAAGERVQRRLRDQRRRQDQRHAGLDRS